MRKQGGLLRTWLRFLPGGIFTTSNIFGFWYLVRMIWRMAKSYTKTLFYLLFTRSPKAAFNFFYTKFFVPVGEGAGAGFYLLFNPIVRKFPRLAPVPRYVEIEVTTICPRKCVMCEHTYWKDQEERHLSFDEFKRILGQFKTLRWLHLTGEGSAFTNPDYPRMLEYAKSKDICVYLVDSFDHIPDAAVEKLIDLKIEGVYISLDGAAKKTYESVRIGCDFDRVLGNIRKFIALKKKKRSLLPEISFRYIVMKPNVHEMPAFLDLVNSFGPRTLLGEGGRVDFVGNLEFPEVKGLSIYKLPEAIVPAVIEKTKKYKLNTFLSHTEPKTNPGIEQCICWLEPYICMGGHVIPCCNILMSNKRTALREHSFGNIFENSMEEIWNSERYKRFRVTLNDPQKKVPFLCTLCRAYDFKERAQKYGVDESL
ncbi:radical SAM/SPASM domain-containing protein [Candidatus Omnitrophota bacterium]